jgi:ribosomal protein S17E
MERFPDKFTADFKANKESVKTLVKTSSPKLRNIIAGYITRMINIEQAAGGVEAEEEEAESTEVKEAESGTASSSDETTPEKKEES